MWPSYLERIFVLEVLADYKNHFAESGVYGVVDRIVHDGFAVGSERVELLEAAVAATHSCSEHKKSRFHCVILFILLKCEML